MSSPFTFSSEPASEAEPPFQAPTEPVVPPPFPEPNRIELPRVYMSWLTPAIFKPGDADADIAAHILGGGGESAAAVSDTEDTEDAEEQDADSGDDSAQ